jgi:hypothetical protein
MIKTDRPILRLGETITLKSEELEQPLVGEEGPTIPPSKTFRAKRKWLAKPGEGSVVLPHSFAVFSPHGNAFTYLPKSKRKAMHSKLRTCGS